MDGWINLCRRDQQVSASTQSVFRFHVLVPVLKHREALTFDNGNIPCDSITTDGMKIYCYSSSGGFYIGRSNLDMTVIVVY